MITKRLKSKIGSHKAMGKIAKIINKSLKPVEDSYNAFRRLLKKGKNRVPDVFNELESLFKSHLITVEQGKELQTNPDFDKFSEIITSGIASRLGSINENKLKKIVKDKSSSSFLDMLTKGLGDETEIDYTKIKKGKLFKRVLIANRGEIALRVIRACRELGIESIQIYTKPDSKSLSVKFADKAVKIGNNASDYLNMHKIIKIAKRAKADAIHPGYGFLAENAGFAKLCKENKIKFIGPSYTAILAMGDKINAKNLIRKSGVRVLEGTNKPVHDVAKGKQIAEKIGYPVIIKAAAGGGGKGMRIIEKEEDFESGFKSCQTEAESAFKNKDVFIEKCVVEPRHVEFQILADGKGNVVHLFERDCSIQRRHQKLIEEAPSAALSGELRKIMGKAAITVASAIKYEGAGTVEFLLDKNNNFYFMEMNTRIQVEHGITEMITGIDLVKEQIKVAAGAELSHKQEDIKIEGWAIECRINAECPAEGFCPSTGTITNYLPPGGPGIRVSSSSHSGQEVNPHYDSLLAKLMCHGKTREETIERTKRALNEFIIDGVNTTIPFHKTVLNNKAFLKGDINTSFIDINKIIEKVKKEHKNRKKVLSKEQKAIIITTAVADYMKKKRPEHKNSNWIQTARQEAVFHE
jgi:acetyl-CoA carboxylase biotin carboxylase subunit